METALQKAPWTCTEGPLADGPERARNSKRLSALALLVVALILGAYLRFDHLTLADLNGDEAVAWVAAIAPSLSAVWTIAPRIDPGKLGVYHAGVATCTALMVATNLTASFLLVAEGLWLGVLLLVKWAGGRAGGLEIFRPGFAVLAGLALLSPVLLEGVTGSWSRAATIFFNWISVRPIAWPYRVLRNSARNPQLFWIFMTLAALGTWRQWRAARLTSVFLALWMTGPLLAVLGVTYLLHPVEMARYVLIAFIGLFALAAVGAASFQSTVVRIALAALIVFLSIPATYHAITHSRVPAWRKAVALAARQTRPDERLAVIPSYETNTVSYYLPANRRNTVVGLDFGCGSERILLFSDWWWLPAKEAQRAKTCYPHIVERLPRVEVRSRG